MFTPTQLKQKLKQALKFLTYGLLNRTRKNQKGMALIMVLSTIIFIILLVQETVFETQIEYRAAVAELNSLRAYYSAKAGMEVNLLRVKTYTALNKQYGDKIQAYRAYVDMIWKLPFIWPLPLGKDANSITAKELSKIQTDSFMQTNIITTIEPENSRIDINDLASPIPSLRKWTFQVLYRLIYRLSLQDKQLEEEISDRDISEILRNIKDWADPDTHQGDQIALPENSLYETNPPPNRSFFTVQELNQVEGMSDLLYKAIEPFITVHGEKSLNINTAPLELLQALHDEFPTELAEEIKALTLNLGQPFLFTKDSFSKFLIEKGMDELEQALFPKKPEEKDKNEENISYIAFDAPYNFRIKSTGIAGTSQKTILATYFNTPKFMAHFSKLIEEEKKREKRRISMRYHIQQTPSLNPENSDDKEQDRSKQVRPRADFEQNSVPTIIYWKESF